MPTAGEARQVFFRGDGRELFIVVADGASYALLACDLRLGTQAAIGAPQELFSASAGWWAIAPAPAGDRFLLLRPLGERGESLTLVQDWRAQLEVEP